MCPNSAISPNDPCPCGSGKKYKRCCELAKAPVRTKWKRFAFGGLIALGVGALVFGPIILRESPSAAGSGIGSGTRLTPAPRPAGAAPPGKVWSVEHGHWHDAPNPLFGLGGQATTLTPQPPGPAAPGMVWSAEHGHWHNAQNPASASGALPVTQSFTPAPQPDGPVPPGKVWSVEHGHWHSDPSAQSGSTPTPVGVPPVTIDFPPKP